MASTALASVDRVEARDLRQAIYGEGDPDRADVEKLITLGRAEGSDEEFAQLLAEVAVDVFVHQADPSGYITDDDANWLIEKLGADGGLACAAEFAMLKRLIGRAVSVPPQLTAFAVREVEKAILTGRRDGFGGVDHEPGVVTPDDVEALRSLVFAPTRGHALHVDSETAQALFDIAHATATADNAPEFPDFFAKAVGNYLLGVEFVGAPDREEELHIESYLARPGGFGSFLSEMFGGGARLSEIDETIGDDQEDADRALNAETTHRLEAAARLTSDETKWVLAHLTRGGILTTAECRLLAFLRDESTSAPQELSDLYDQAA